MKNIKKADLKEFLSKTERMLLDNGFKRTVESDPLLTRGYEWRKETQYGLLLLKPDNEFPDKVFSIFGRFEDTKKANEILIFTGGNTYSGKCNFHTFEKDEILIQFENFLALIA